MLKVVEIDTREQQLIREALLRAVAEKAKLRGSDDPGIARIGYRVERELRDLIAKIDHAELA